MQTHVHVHVSVNILTISQVLIIIIVTQLYKTKEINMSQHFPKAPTYGIKLSCIHQKIKEYNCQYKYNIDLHV